MTGYIRIEAVPEGLKGEVQLEHVRHMDKLHIMHTVAKSLDMDDRELELFALMESAGLLELMHHRESTLISRETDCSEEQAKNPESKEARFDKVLDALKQVFMEDSYE